MSKCGLMLMWNWMTMSCGEFVEGWEISGYIQIHQDTHIFQPDDGSSSVRSTGISDCFSSYLQGTTKTSPCCWLHTLPPERWESAEPVSSPYTAASLTGRTPLCCTFLMNPMIHFQTCYCWKLHTIIRHNAGNALMCFYMYGMWKA